MSPTLTLVEETDPILTQVAPEFDFRNPVVDPVRLTADMLDLMVASNGIGLAAPQCGLSVRVFVMRRSDGRDIACFNPTFSFLDPTETEVGVEGCLSFPDLWLKVNRLSVIQGAYYDARGNLVNEMFAGMDARCYLHETDHLNGIRFTDLVGPLALKHARTRRTKHFKKG